MALPDSSAYPAPQQQDKDGRFRFILHAAIAGVSSDPSMRPEQIAKRAFEIAKACRAEITNRKQEID